VGVGLAEAGGGVVGMGIVVVLGEELADGGAAHETRRRATSEAIARRVAQGDRLSSVGVF